MLLEQGHGQDGGEIKVSEGGEEEGGWRGREGGRGRGADCQN